MSKRITRNSQRVAKIREIIGEINYFKILDIVAGKRIIFPKKRHQKDQQILKLYLTTTLSRRNISIEVDSTIDYVNNIVRAYRREHPGRKSRFLDPT